LYEIFILIFAFFSLITLLFKKEDQDPRRMTFYLNYFKDQMTKVFKELESLNLENKHKSSFQQVNTLQLFTTFSQFEWRIQRFWSNLLILIQNNLGNNYKLIREILPA
jgi:hypothetical protein